MRYVHRSRGFTLVELLIVVAIIGILAAVLTPQFLNARKVAADRAAEAYAHNVYTAVQAHIAETGSLIPPDTLVQISSFGCKDGWKSFSTNYPVPAPSSALKLESCSIGQSGESVTLKYTGGVAGERTITVPPQ